VTPRKRRPKGYTGNPHETIGSDILSVFRILKLPDQVLGKADADRLREVDPKAWYSIDWMLDLMDRLDAALGHYGLLRMGRTVFDLSHRERVTQVAHSARDIVYGLDDMYRRTNRGRGIGGWKVLRFEPGFAELENTTPHHCIMEQGLLSAAFAAVKCPGLISQRDCFRLGADACTFTITSSLTDERWAGASTSDAR
jgi:hypothetical protein